MRKVFAQPDSLSAVYPELGQSLGEALLTPTKIYVKPVLALLAEAVANGRDQPHHGRGLFENLAARVAFRPGDAHRHRGDLPLLADLRPPCARGQHSGTRHVQHVQHGLGMVIVVARDVDAALSVLAAAGEPATVIGVVTENAGIELEGVQL